MSTLNDTYDPKPGKPYAQCESCQIALATKAEAEAHMHDTFEQTKAAGGSSGHRIRITNPTRQERVLRAVERELEDAIREEPGEIDLFTRKLDITEDAVELAVDKLERATDRGDFTEAEVTEALARQPEFLEAWTDAHPAPVGVDPEQPPLFDDSLIDA